jgi:ribosomal protein S4
VVKITIQKKLTLTTKYKIKSKKNRKLKKILLRNIKLHSYNYYFRLKKINEKKKSIFWLALYVYSNKLVKNRLFLTKRKTTKKYQQQINLIEKRVDTILARVGFTQCTKTSATMIKLKRIFKNDGLIKKNNYCLLTDKIKFNLFKQYQPFLWYTVLQHN